MGGQIWYW
ncbi:MAG: hypothetical protein EZS28_042312, partial [Streblomastix strix]